MLDRHQPSQHVISTGEDGDMARATWGRGPAPWRGDGDVRGKRQKKKEGKNDGWALNYGGSASF